MGTRMRCLHEETPFMPSRLMRFPNASMKCMQSCSRIHLTLSGALRYFNVYGRANDLNSMYAAAVPILPADYWTANPLPFMAMAGNA